MKTVSNIDPILGQDDNLHQQFVESAPSSSNDRKNKKYWTVLGKKLDVRNNKRKMSHRIKQQHIFYLTRTNRMKAKEKAQFLMTNR